MRLDPGLRRLALGTLLAAYPGPTPPDWAVELVADGLAGHTLFGRNIDEPAQVAASTAALRTARADVLVAIDEEGGDVTRLAHATGSPYPGNAALGAIDDEALTRDIHQAIGAELAALGVTVNLAPTVDVNSTDDNPVIGTRSFGAAPGRGGAPNAAAGAGRRRRRPCRHPRAPARRRIARRGRRRGSPARRTARAGPAAVGSSRAHRTRPAQASSEPSRGLPRPPSARRAPANRSGCR